MADKPKNPTVNFAGHAMPSHEAWKRIQMVIEATDHLDRLNQIFSGLSTDSSRDCVERVRRHMKGVDVEIAKKPQQVPLEQMATSLVALKGLDGALDAIRSERGMAINLHDLVQLIGLEAYEKALIEELGSEDFQKNRLSAQQIAYLWNESKRPAPGKPFWDERTVQILMDRRTRGNDK
ncbi:conserved hypothetical protein [Gammaproteobacteria bacterium]